MQQHTKEAATIIDAIINWLNAYKGAITAILGGIISLGYLLMFIEKVRNALIHVKDFIVGAWILLKPKKKKKTTKKRKTTTKKRKTTKKKKK